MAKLYQAPIIDSKTPLFYHGTFPQDNAESILKNGFNQLICGTGYLGHGVYLTKNIEIARWYSHLWEWVASRGKTTWDKSPGQWVVPCRLARGVRILDVTSEKIDGKTLKQIRKEFGHDILKGASPHKIIPKNKHLTKDELAALLHYGFQQVFNLKRGLDTMNTTKQENKYLNAIQRYWRSMVIRAGYDGFGEPLADIGIVVFHSYKVIPIKITYYKGAVPDVKLIVRHTK